MKKSLFKNIIFKFILNIFNIIIPLFVGSYISRKFNPKLMGDLGFTQSLFGYFFIFAGFGVYQYGLREISRVRDNKDKMESVFTGLFSVAMITNIITTLVYIIFVNKAYSQSSIYVISMIMAFNFISNIFYVEWVNEALENFDFITIKTIIVQSIYAILVFLIVKSSENFNQYVILLGITTFLNNFISFLYIKRKIKFNFKNVEFKRHIMPMLMVVILSNANVLYTQLDRVMLGSIIDTTVVSYYVMAQGIVGIINVLMLTIVHVSIPRLSNFLANGEEEEYEKLIEVISKIYFMLLFPAAVGVSVIAKECILIYGGEKYLPAVPMLTIFAFYMITTGYENVINNQVMYLKRKENIQVRIILICGIINLILNYILIKMNIFSGESSIITTMIANSIMVIAEYIYIRRNLKIKLNFFSVDKLKYFAISLLFIPISSVLRLYVSGTITTFLVLISVNMLIYLLILVLIRDKSIKMLIDMVLKRGKK